MCLFAGSAGSTSWVQWKWSDKDEDKSLEISLWHINVVRTQKEQDDDGDKNDMDWARREIDDEFKNIKAISANRGTTITGLVLGLWPTVIFAYDAARCKKHATGELVGGVFWLLAGVIAFAGSGYWEKRMEANSFLDRQEWERWKDDYDEETHCHYGCDLEFVAAAFSVALGGCMVAYSRIAPEVARAKVPSAAPPPSAVTTDGAGDLEV